jgi:hypothetical protein
MRGTRALLTTARVFPAVRPNLRVATSMFLGARMHEVVPVFALGGIPGSTWPAHAMPNSLARRPPLEDRSCDAPTKTSSERCVSFGNIRTAHSTQSRTGGPDHSMYSSTRMSWNWLTHHGPCARSRVSLRGAVGKLSKLIPDSQVSRLVDCAFGAPRFTRIVDLS